MGYFSIIIFGNRRSWWLREMDFYFGGRFFGVYRRFGASLFCQGFWSNIFGAPSQSRNFTGQRIFTFFNYWHGRTGDYLFFIGNIFGNYYYAYSKNRRQ